MSKGSRSRPLSVSKEKFDDNFDRIFGKKANIETLTIRVSGTTAHGPRVNAVTGKHSARAQPEGAG
jgi:hypothetical protein